MRRASDVHKHLISAIFVVFFIFAFGTNARAEVFIVDRLTDAGEGEGVRGDLRYCIAQANAMPGDDSIVFLVTGVINLSSALQELRTNIQINGPGANLLTVRRNAGGDYRIFTVNSGATVLISSLTVANGSVSNDHGGGVLNRGTLTIMASNIAANRAGGEMYFDAYGGGIFNLGMLTVIDSTILGNSVFGGYFDGDYWFGVGGGIANLGTLTIGNSTISGNRAWANYGAASGGGIANEAVLTISHSTIAGNMAHDGPGGGILNTRGLTLDVRNTIVAGNTVDVGGPDLAGPLTSSGYNLIGNSRGGSGYDSTDLLDVNPRLGPLQDNGGPTHTHALLTGSPATDLGDNTGAPDFDQRGVGFARIVNGTVDRGAYEVQQASGNLLLNPGFETGHLTPWIGWGTAGVASNYPHAGTFHGFIVPSTAASGVFQEVTVATSGSYTFEAYVAEGNLSLVGIGITVDGITTDFAWVTGSSYSRYTVIASSVSAGQVVGVFLWGDVSPTGWAVIDTTSLTRNP